MNKQSAGWEKQGRHEKSNRKTKIKQNQGERKEDEEAKRQWERKANRAARGESKKRKKEGKKWEKGKESGKAEGYRTKVKRRRRGVRKRKEELKRHNKERRMGVTRKGENHEREALEENFSRHSCLLDLFVQLCTLRFAESKNALLVCVFYSLRLLSANGPDWWLMFVSRTLSHPDNGWEPRKQGKKDGERGKVRSVLSNKARTSHQLIWSFPEE